MNNGAGRGRCIAVETDEAAPARTPGERGEPIAHHRRHAKALRRGGAERAAFAGANLADRERGGGDRRGTIVADKFRPGARMRRQSARGAKGVEQIGTLRHVDDPVLHAGRIEISERRIDRLGPRRRRDAEIAEPVELQVIDGAADQQRAVINAALHDAQRRADRRRRRRVDVEPGIALDSFDLGNLCWLNHRAAHPRPACRILPAVGVRMMIASPASSIVASQPASLWMLPSLRRTAFSPT